MASEAQMKNPLFVGKAIRAQLEHEIPQDLPLERDFREGTDYTITDHVLDLHERLTPDVRTKEVFRSLITHLHAFARETNLTHAEWANAIQLLTRAGKESTPNKNEFVLLSDCMGLSALVDELEHPKPPGCTDSCEEGPFFTTDAPEVPSGSDISGPNTIGERMFFQATIKNTKGEGIPGAKADVWQADGEGMYDVQYPNRNDGVADDRATIIAESNGQFCYRGRLPVAYPIPNDGPIGDVLRALGRHPHRSSHLHFLITAPGYDSLTTAVYPSHSPFLGTDPVFATKKSLICDLEEVKDEAEWRKMGFKEGDVPNRRVWVWKFNFVLPSVEEVENLKKQRRS
ncbi:hypothetical protein Clacol_008103 [Clathrus columnatus]|uniref:Aromatic compound dioxygenase n=1 Tax=Clathrus columnatus TaxID=1419009 RepID=A0AAV5AGT0_9AGAM|nr:hypothetical protein Clacol_008103 [Clathrus columnatus]